MPKTEVIKIKISPELKERFQFAIQSNGSKDIGMSFVVRRMIENYVKTFEQEGILIV